MRPCREASSEEADIRNWGNAPATGVAAAAAAGDSRDSAAAVAADRQCLQKVAEPSSSDAVACQVKP
eukprot:CAMPEP_0204014902 /NCGR_PEP_ID=MMETSP0360-20130528/25710_1 /ASSEMBLY_ACC=CAM_ASM_000342 /TAXON_ID=268821 /ORGANISM="Scrippsiella Hangoei, Strain SHTV-5" /LENGTH=66 /DNA_ID=CAMNT_0050957771 /DNA_START=75 /DNA_END=276 /DNA_ORIENTATION=-